MPRYIYRCGECENEFETSHSITESLKDCPSCSIRTEKGTLFRVPSFYIAKKEPQNAGKVGDIVKSKIEEFRQEIKEEKRELQEREYDS